MRKTVLDLGSTSVYFPRPSPYSSLRNRTSFLLDILTILISWKWNHIYCNPDDVSQRYKTPVSWPNRGEERRRIEMRMMSRCFTRFPNSWLLRTQYITELGVYYKYVGFYLEGVWLWRISGSYSLEMMGVILCRCSVELVWCSRSHWSPSASIRWGENVSWSTHRHKGTVSVFDCIELFEKEFPTN